MGKIEKAKTDDLGMKVSGSNETGHTITLTREHALNKIFGTTDAAQASALLSHCLKHLKADEARAEINELVREAREIERMLCGGEGGLKDCTPHIRTGAGTLALVRLRKNAPVSPLTRAARARHACIHAFWA